MLNTFSFAVIMGILLGFLSGLGVGGGSLLILWLTLVLDTPQETARIINLLFFLPAALVSCLFHQKQGVFSLRKVFPAILAGCLGAYLSARITPALNTHLLKKLLGILLLFSGLRELRWKPKRE